MANLCRKNKTKTQHVIELNLSVKSKLIFNNDSVSISSKVHFTNVNAFRRSSRSNRIIAAQRDKTSQTDVSKVWPLTVSNSEAPVLEIGNENLFNISIIPRFILSGCTYLCRICGSHRFVLKPFIIDMAACKRKNNSQEPTSEKK